MVKTSNNGSKHSDSTVIKAGLKQSLLSVALCFSFVTVGCSSTASKAKTYNTFKKQKFAKNGVASYYAHRFHGRLTANGERFNMNAMTAAHKKLKFGTRLRVTNKANGRSVIVRINDRGPYVGRRIIDVSLAAAKKLGMVKRGVANVKLEVVK